MPSFLFYVCVRFASNLCEGKLEVLSLDNTRQTRAKVEVKSVGTHPKQDNSSKKIQKRKLLFSCRIVGGVIVVACTYFIRGKYILTTLTNTNFSTRAFSEREREREKSVNNGNANASFVSTNDATKIDAKQHSKIIVEKENI